MAKKITKTAKEGKGKSLTTLKVTTTTSKSTPDLSKVVK